MKDAAGIFIYIYNSTVYLYILHTANFQPRIYCGHVDSLHIHSFASRPFMNNSLSSLLSVTRHNLIGAKSLKGQWHESCVCELRYLMERFQGPPSGVTLFYSTLVFNDIRHSVICRHLHAGHNVPVKVTVSRDLWLFFLLKRFDLGPIWTDKNGLADFFIFAKIFEEKKTF